jgi:hypothetical protein
VIFTDSILVEPDGGEVLQVIFHEPATVRSGGRFSAAGLFTGQVRLPDIWPEEMVSVGTGHE